MKKIILPLFILLLPVLAQSAIAQDLNGFWTVRFEQEPTGTELFGKIPADATYINDAGGGELSEGDYGGLKLTERALEEIRNYDFDYEFSTSYSCMPPTSVFYMQAPFPMEIHQGRDMIVFRMEYFDMVRIIFMDGRDKPGPDFPHTKNGHSIGHWDGDELVVDTTHLQAGTFMNNGFNHSEDIHMTERFKLSEDGNVLWLIQVYEDPAVFAGKSARYMAWSKVPGEHIYPYDCDPSFGR
jgi:hypothetical protein